jgi:hypothetical protein
MVFQPEWKNPPKSSKKRETRGAPEAPRRYFKALLSHPGKWARISTYTSGRAAKLLAKAWAEDYPELEFRAVRLEVYARAHPAGEEVETVSQAVTHPGASVRPQGKKEDLPNQVPEWTQVTPAELYPWEVLKKHPKWHDDFKACSLADAHEELGLLI